MLAPRPTARRPTPRSSRVSRSPAVPRPDGSTPSQPRLQGYVREALTHEIVWALMHARFQTPHCSTARIKYADARHAQSSASTTRSPSACSCTAADGIASSATRRSMAPLSAMAARFATAGLVCDSAASPVQIKTLARTATTYHCRQATREHLSPSLERPPMAIRAIG